VITNIPTAEDLRTVSLRLYFKAWAETTGIVVDWYEYSGLLELPPRSPDEGGGGDQEPRSDGAWQSYINASQSDLQGIYTLIQQSQEIGLKALICEVSPFLLLRSREAKPAVQGTQEYDFTDFPTIDAADLVKVHNTFCNRTISPGFQQQADEIRKGRNKISHLGIFPKELDPAALIEVLLTQYVELYPGRRWLADRLHYGSIDRWSFAEFDKGDWSPKTSVFAELWHMLPALPDHFFRIVMQHGIDEPRYICHECAREAHLGESEPYPHDIPTAYRVGDSMQVRCVMCEKDYRIREEACTNEGCGANLASDEPDSDGDCLVCGYGKIDVEFERKRLEEMKNRVG
jgi:hypothetical protein